MTSYTEFLQKLYSINLHHGIKLGLNPMQRLCRALGSPESSFPSVHVAGTNGKGSVTTKIAKAFEIAGLRVGVYTSPHLSSFRERIRINGTLISEQEVVALLSHLFELIQEENISATFFEITTCLAFTYFAQQDVDIAIIETGLGGRLDATNILVPLLSVITSISLEHTEILGETIEEIAREKAGIIKPGIPTICGPSVPEKLLTEIAKEKGSKIKFVRGVYAFFDEENSAIASLALQELRTEFPLSEEDIDKAIQFRPHCRMEFVTKDSLSHWNTAFPPGLILDVAHNPDGFTHLFSALKKMFSKEKFRIILGLSKTKDIHKCLQIIAPHVHHLHLVEAPNGRGMSAELLFSYAVGANVSPEKISVGVDLRKEILFALSEGVKFQQFVLICGTFFIMSTARGILGMNEPRDPLDLNEATTKSPVHKS